MAGCTTHGSYVKWIGKPQEGKVSVNEVLWKAGAVFYARTTQPQAVMHLETSSNIYGVTTNPHNTNLTPGGSSGGESALIAFRGSVLVSTHVNIFDVMFCPTHESIGCWRRYWWFNQGPCRLHRYLWFQTNTLPNWKNGRGGGFRWPRRVYSLQKPNKYLLADHHSAYPQPKAHFRHLARA